ncbi:MAG: hypothetical protein ACRDBG_01300 [Waterburya sp.]
MATGGTPTTPLLGGTTPSLGNTVQPTNLTNIGTPGSVVTVNTGVSNQVAIPVIDAGKNIKTIPFSGKKEDFTIWSSRFLSYLHLNNCKSTILGKTIIPNDTTDLDPTNPLHVPLIQARSANNLAMLLLTMAITDTTSYGALYAAQTTENAEGNCAIAWKELNNIYKPMSKAKQYELEQEFNKCALTDESKNPDEWFTELERIKLQLKLDFDQHEIDEAKLIQHILFNTKPSIYATTLQIIIRELNQNHNPSLSSIKEEMRQVYGQYKLQGTASKKGQNQDMALIVIEVLRTRGTKWYGR